MKKDHSSIESEGFPIVRICLVSLLLVCLGAGFVYATDSAEAISSPVESIVGGQELLSDSLSSDAEESVQPPFERTDLLLAESIAYASLPELQEMCRLRKLDASGTVEHLRERLLSYHGLKAAEIEISDVDGQDPVKTALYDLEILDAQMMRSAGNSDDLVVLEGRVTISFTPSGGGAAKELSASRMVIDLVNTRLTAMGGVTFKDGSENSAVQDVSGDIVSLDWHSGNLEVSGGTTSSKKKNSDNKDVEFFTSGTQIDYRGDAGGIQIHEGYVTTNPETSYSSISAESMSMLPGGDMFVSNAYLSIGRVPVFWVPFFFYPGSTLIFNPAFGFSSDRGMFLSTTYEVYGSYPKFKDAKQSSFTSLLATKSEGGRVKDGVIYAAATGRGETEGLEGWAQKSGSYLALMADAYQKSGVFAGFDSSTNLWEKKLVIDAGGGLAFSPGKTSSSGYYHPTFRYMGKLSAKLDTKIVDLTLDIPLYSDPSMQKLYGNRLTSFSLDALFGSTQSFPTDYSSDITSYTWKAGGKLSLPTEIASPYISKLEISKFDTSATFQWKTVAGSSPTIYSYQISSMTLPELTASMAGTLFTLKKDIAAKDDTARSERLSELEAELAVKKELARNTAEPVPLDQETASTQTGQKASLSGADTSSSEGGDVENSSVAAASSANVDIGDAGATDADVTNATDAPTGDVSVSEMDLATKSGAASVSVSSNKLEETTGEKKDAYDDSGLPTLYQPITAKSTNGNASAGTHKLSLAYTIDQTLTNKYAAATNAQSSSFGPQTLYSATKGSLTLEGNIAPAWFKFSEKISPSLTISEEEANSNYKSTQIQLTSNTTAELPFLGLKYSLVTKLYNYRKIVRDTVDPEIIEQWVSWDSNFVTTHQLSLTKSFTTGIGTFSSSLTGILPPLRFSLLPALAWRYGGWSSNLSYKFVDDGNGNMKSDLVTLTLGYNEGLVTTSFTGTYQTSSYVQGDNFWNPFALKGYFALNFFNKRLEVKQALDFAVVATAGRNVFNSLVSSVSYKPVTGNSTLAMASVTFTGPAETLRLSALDLQTNLTNLSFSWWKRRIKLGFSLTTKLHFDFLDKYSSGLTVTAKVDFSIAEFLSLTMSVTSSNNGFFSYYDDSDKFSWGLLFDDLRRSFDFFGGGRSHTQFNMESVSIELIHYMKDWDLHCKYTGSVVLSGRDWQWVPKVSIFLQWNTIPELKVDEKWTRKDNVWTQGT
ncbi:MAG: hypothetical protein SPD11_01595 [Sphaerochaetaceae bacterium]|nr:hypothetical protein [Sphaerochaetaceae bacterium]